jgi:hypothetical protein
VYSNNVVFASKAWFDKLPADLQAGIREAVAEAMVLVRTESIKFDKELVVKLQSGGMVVNEIKDKTPFVEGTKAVYDQFATVFPPELVKRIRETPSNLLPVRRVVGFAVMPSPLGATPSGGTRSKQQVGDPVQTLERLAERVAYWTGICVIVWWRPSRWWFRSVCCFDMDSRLASIGLRN